ncbi:transglutaminase family protein [Microbacterium betulae]|uniref:Transglutaminase family protein n=1 Tax=Microbacterium betulae TaxID=2981139 RepID=A0AA97FI48_9MICO|nr:transglutaminase family protein [Microbacterium sp. AB]WOF23323.1 transglutaminase family protein [Microbacterium sp. AB]
MTHRTTYAYDEDVHDSHGVGRLVPRPLPWQIVAEHRVEVRPRPLALRTGLDGYGNELTSFQVTDPHRSLVVEATSDVRVEPPVYDAAALAAPWEESRPCASDAASAWAATEFALESPQAAHAEEAHDYAAPSLVPGRPVGEAVTDLVHRIHSDFAYDGAATTVTSTVEEVLRTRAGVCQDFAHLMLACLRSHGVAARYVSGYLATEPPPGEERMVGADASHAWVAVWLPGSDAWLAVDPTNDRWAGDRHVTVAWGRDYGDVAPVKGVIFTEARRSTLEVSVDVAPLGGVDDGRRMGG